MGFYKVKPGSVYMHGCYIPEHDNFPGAIVATVKDVETSKSYLHVIKDPQYNFYTTKKMFRNHEYKKEWAHERELDIHTCKFRQLADKLNRALNGHSFGYANLRKLMQSPYVYGADIDPLIHLKMSYMESEKRPVKFINVGSLDIEINIVSEDEEINVASFCDGASHVVYCHIIESYLKGKTIDNLNKIQEIEYQKFRDNLNPNAQAIWDKKPFTTKYTIHKDERSLILGLFNDIHICKPDFCGAWNMGFDIPHIIQRAEYRQIPLTDLFSHPNLPKELQYVKWKEDKSKQEHYTDIWHWMETSGYTQYYDPMCLYSRIRKVLGRELFYSLDYIGTKHLGSGKMSFGQHGSHADMQMNHFAEYCVYNTIDTIIPVMLDELLNDVRTWLSLVSCSLISDFSRQTVLMKAQLYAHFKKDNCILASSMGSIETPYDKFIFNTGGAVINPMLIYEIGTKLFKECSDLINLIQLACDIDVSSFYPSIIKAMGISKETKLYTVLYLENMPYKTEDVLNETNAAKKKMMMSTNSNYIFELLALYNTPSENAVYLGKKFFKLPDYNGMLELFKQECM